MVSNHGGRILDFNRSALEALPEVVDAANGIVRFEDEGETVLKAGDIAAWPKGVRNGHCLQNRGDADCVMLAVSAGDAANDWGEYPDIDLRFAPEGYLHKDGTPYPPKR